MKINIKKILRTPEERFANLPDYNFPPNYMVIGEGLRMHFVDEGAEDALVVLLLHGEPSWSYLYRKMIPILIKNGFRVIAPDLIGFGKLDKLTDMNKCSYQSHIDWVSYLVSSLDLKDIMLFCQDWGGLIGLRMAAETPNRFAKIVVSNTMLPTGEHRMPDTFLQWREFSQSSPEFDIGGVINMGTISDLSEEVLAPIMRLFLPKNTKPVQSNAALPVRARRTVLQARSSRMERQANAARAGSTVLRTRTGSAALLCLIL